MLSSVQNCFDLQKSGRKGCLKCNDKGNSFEWKVKNVNGRAEHLKLKRECILNGTIERDVSWLR